jgi:hypothetical protein
MIQLIRNKITGETVDWIPSDSDFELDPDHEIEIECDYFPWNGPLDEWYPIFNYFDKETKCQGTLFINSDTHNQYIYRRFDGKVFKANRLKDLKDYVLHS